MDVQKPNNSFVRQAAILAIASLFVRLIGFLYRIPLTNLLGDGGIGIYATAYTVYTFAIVLSSGALPGAVSRLVSHRIAREEYGNAHQMFRTAFIFAVAMATVVAVVMWFGAGAFARYFSDGESTDAAMAIRALAPTVVFVAMLAVFRGYFQGRKTMMPTAVSQVVEQIFNVIFTVVLARAFMDVANMRYAVTGASVGTGIGAVAGLAVVGVLYLLVAKGLRKQAAGSRRYNAMVKGYTTKRTRRGGEPYDVESLWQQMGAIFRTALPMILGMGIYSVANIIDIRMIMSRMPYGLDGEALLGQFLGKFILLTTLPVSLSLALSAAVIPELTSSSVQRDDGAIRHKTNMALRLSMMLSIPAAVGLGVLANPVIALLFPSHPEGGLLLQVGAVSIVFISLTHVLTGALQGLGFVGLPIVAAFFGVMVKVPVNFFLIARPGVNVLGAVVSTILCYVVASAIAMFFLYQKKRILPSLTGAFIKPLFAAIGMGMVCYVVYFVVALFAPNGLATVLALGMGVLSYVVFMCMIKGFRPSDIQAMPLPRRVKALLSA